MSQQNAHMDFSFRHENLLNSACRARCVLIGKNPYIVATRLERGEF